MSCLGKSYLPIPPRAWSRVQNECSTVNTNTSNTKVYVPLLKKSIYKSELPAAFQMLAKGNVLQYKANSSNLTKNQRYSQIAKGKWTNRTTTWATQSDKYSNPNTNHLKRVGVTSNITLGGVSTNQPITCPLNSNVNDFDSTIVIANGGRLLCNVVENPCSKEVLYKTKGQQLCNLTTSSDVPGKIQNLCWNDGLPTYYPRTRLNMNNSTNKWSQFGSNSYNGLNNTCNSMSHSSGTSINVEKLRVEKFRSTLKIRKCFDDSDNQGSSLDAQSPL
jgi:hypothetical protein